MLGFHTVMGSLGLEVFSVSEREEQGERKGILGTQRAEKKG